MAILSTRKPGMAHNMLRSPLHTRVGSSKIMIRNLGYTIFHQKLPTHHMFLVRSFSTESNVIHSFWKRFYGEKSMYLQSFFKRKGYLVAVITLNGASLLILYTLLVYMDQTPQFQVVIQRMECQAIRRLLLWVLPGFCGSSGVLGLVIMMLFKIDKTENAMLPRGTSGEAESSVPNPIQQQPHGAQEIPQDLLWNELEQPLIEEKERTLQLRAKLANRFYFRNQTVPETLRFEHEVQTHVNVEIEVEKRLRMEGYLPREINNSRAEIRELLLYTRKGKPVQEYILEGYLSEMETDFPNSTPFRILKKARDNHNLSLYKPGDFFYKED
uniref:Uncharacterized protein n=1 Tax=Zelkova schneideriana TaxID=172643 RepID=A0A8F1N7J6_9ROSA|nr:hypothetical protein [Zelkova schneideriana]